MKIKSGEFVIAFKDSSDLSKPIRMGKLVGSNSYRNADDAKSKIGKLAQLVGVEYYKLGVFDCEGKIVI